MASRATNNNSQYADLKDFAAGRAYVEEKVRANVEIGSLLEIEDETELLAQVSETLRDKVETALHQQQSIKNPQPCKPPAASAAAQACRSAP